MTLHAKNGKPGCISFRFFYYYFPEWVPPLVTPLKGGGKKSGKGRGVVYHYTCRKKQT